LTRLPTRGILFLVDIETTILQEEQQLRRQLIVKALVSRADLTLGHLESLLSSDTHGGIAKTITLRELLDAQEPQAKKKKTKKAPSNKPKKAPSNKPKKAAKEAGEDDAAARSAVFDALEAAEEPVSLAEIVEATELEADLVRKILKSEIGTGKVEVSGKGKGTKYALA
jgi:hypothetical protein